MGELVRSRPGFTDIQMVRPAQAAALLGVHRATLYRWVRDGALPPPVKLGSRTKNRCSAWRLGDLRAFIAKRADAR